MEKLQVFIHKRDSKIIQELIREGYYSNPSQCIRDVLRRHLKHHARNLRRGPAGVENRQP